MTEHGHHDHPHSYYDECYDIKHLDKHLDKPRHCNHHEGISNHHAGKIIPGSEPVHFGPLRPFPHHSVYSHRHLLYEDYFSITTHHPQSLIDQKHLPKESIEIILESTPLLPSPIPCKLSPSSSAATTTTTSSSAFRSRRLNYILSAIIFTTLAIPLFPFLRDFYTDLLTTHNLSRQEYCSLPSHQHAHACNGGNFGWIFPFPHYASFEPPGTSIEDGTRERGPQESEYDICRRGTAWWWNEAAVKVILIGGSLGITIAVALRNWVFAVLGVVVIVEAVWTEVLMRRLCFGVVEGLGL